MLKQKNQPHYLGHRGRLKQRLQDSPRALADYEILELLLGYANPRRDAKPLAKALLERFGSLRGVYQARQADLMEVEGFGEGLNVFWGLWREFLARLGEQDVRERVLVDDPKVVADLARERLGHLTGEEFWVLLVDASNRVLGWERVSRGTVDQTPVYPREVLALALNRQAAGLVMVHNHPSGDPKPSNADVEITRQVKLAAHGLGVKLLDHVIVADKKFYSFRKASLM
ncbi:RadC family protein [Fundidesulfovibrio agrisoli]|uniref:RadC family protein n=1 Tax=Fundidesulfovibrio agrisoli TaxID=2922717 RepID=UPI001FAB75B8|nr:DNA repair protein RadC [Fundidesulfovibrio agrisoli]